LDQLTIEIVGDGWRARTASNIFGHPILYIMRPLSRELIGVFHNVAIGLKSCAIRGKMHV
jgi:hypothetical protein